MSFKKYSSLTNHYIAKDIERFKGIYFDELNDTDWIVQEKLHGANFSFLFQPNIDVMIFSRNQQVDENFYNAGEITLETINEMKSVQEYANTKDISVRVYGELFGGNVQKGVNYGTKKMIRFYDLQFDDKQQSVQVFDNFFTEMGIVHLCVPKLDIVPTLELALEFSIDRNTAYCNYCDVETVDGYLIEGVVIKPYQKVFIDMNGSLFYIKHKNEKFKESQSVKKIRTKTQYSEEVNKWREIFLSYFHLERLESVFSKVGRIDTIRDIGKYIPLIHQDALETFMKEEDYPEEVITKAERKYIFNSSKVVVELLKESMS